MYGDITRRVIVYVKNILVSFIADKKIKKKLKSEFKKLYHKSIRANITKILRKIAFFLTSSFLFLSKNSEYLLRFIRYSLILGT